MRMASTLTAIAILACSSLSGFAAEKSVAQTDNNNGESAAIDDGEFGKDYFQKAILLFRDGRFEKAAKYFRMAYDARHNYKMLNNVAQAEMSAKRYGLALEALQEYLDTGGDDIPANSRKQALKEISVLQQMVGTVFIQAADDCTITINDVGRGTAPLAESIALKAAPSHIVKIAYQEEIIFTKAFSLKAGQTIRIDASNVTEKAIEDVKTDAHGKEKQPIEMKAPEPQPEPSASEEKMDNLLGRAGLQSARINTFVGVMSTGAAYMLYGGLLYSIYRDDFGWESYLVTGGVAVGLSLWPLIRYLYLKKKLGALQPNDSMSIADKLRLLETSMYWDRGMGWFSFGLGMASSVFTGVCLGIGLAKDDKEITQMSHAGVPLAVGLLSASAFSLIRYKKNQGEYTRLKRENATPPKASLSPAVSPQRNGGLLGLKGRF